MEFLIWMTVLYWLIAAAIFVTAAMQTSRFKGGYTWNPRSQEEIRRNARIARRAWIWPWLILLGIWYLIKRFGALMAELRIKSEQ